MVKPAFTFVIALLVYELTAWPGPCAHPEHAIQAWYWLQGHVSVDGAAIWERIPWRGHWYEVAHPPLNAAVMVPALLLGIDQARMARTIAALDCALVYWICAKRAPWCAGRSCDEAAPSRSPGGLLLDETAALCAILFGFGTNVWFEASKGWSWGFCSVLSCAPTLLALEALDGGRSGAAGMWGGLAALARIDLVAVWPVYWWRNGGWKVQGRAWTFPAWCVAAMLCYMGYNLLKFRVPYDISFFQWWAHDPAPKLSASGPFSIHYLPYNLLTATVMAPEVQAAWPWLRPSMRGQALWTFSPALLLAFRRGGCWLWLCAVVAMEACFLTYSNGTEQLGPRFWIQAYPFLIVMIAQTWTNSIWEKLLIGISVVLSGGQMWIVRRYGWAM